MNSERKMITIVGVGLIGGSLAIRLHEKKLCTKLIGVEANPEHAKQALELELVDEILPLDEAIDQSGVIILALPVDVMTNILLVVLDKVKDQIVMDVGSTKDLLIKTVAKHPRRGRFVATHPMWGTEYNGPKSAVKNAFENKVVVLCNPEESDADARQWVAGMYEKIGMQVLEMEAKAHDLHAAYVSHISHVTSFALANTVLEKEKEDEAIFAMASSGFESTVRLAKSHPAMWVPIFLQNKENVLDVLKEHITQLKRFKECLENDDEEYLKRLIEEANRIKKILK
ncbi:MAG: prephenate dehydrogenase [Sphingobacteriales bacterium]|nr:prephenate dehydrogenase [Sphingobacteriales bacterium]